MSKITIYHNPACGTSRNTLEMIRNSGVEPTIIYYLDNQLVHTSILGVKVLRANDLNFEFDNDGSGFIVDNIIIKDMDQLAVKDINKTKISISPNPVLISLM